MSEPRSPEFCANAVESVADVLEETAEKIRPGADVVETIDVLATNAGLLRALAPSIRQAGAIPVSGLDRAAGKGAVVVALVRVQDGEARVVCSRVVEEGESFLAAAGRLYEEEEHQERREKALEEWRERIRRKASAPVR